VGGIARVDPQLGAIRDLLKKLIGQGLTKESKTYAETLDILKKFPRLLTLTERREFQGLIQKAFSLEEETLELPGPSPTGCDQGFDRLIPATGWFRDYHTYTLGSEAPAAFHFTSALVALGVTLGRRVFFDKGFYRVYPNVAAVLIAPTGKCRKTSATNVALDLLRATGVRILADKTTPEALVQGLSGQEEAIGLLYAPELAVFLGRQRYLEGMVPLLTALFDAPERWSSNTIARGQLTLAKVALSMLAASTIDWFTDALPNEAFSGGFMSRLLFVVQQDTDRTFALPQRPPGTLWEHLRETLVDLKTVKGEAVLSDEGHNWYLEWYSKHHQLPIADEKFAGYQERKPDHLLRLATMISLTTSGSLVISPETCTHSLNILNYFEKDLPHVFTTVAETHVGEVHTYILRLLKKEGGRLPHSVLLRRLQHKINGRAFREAIDTLKDSESIREHKDSFEHYYEILNGGKK